MAQAWRDHRARFLDQFTPVNVDARLWAERWDNAREWSIRCSSMEVSGSPPGEGWRTVRLEFMDDLHALTVLQHLGSGIRIEAPDDIRTKLLYHIDQIATLYRF